MSKKPSTNSNDGEKYFTVEVKHVEYFSSRVLVRAKNVEEAKEKVQNEWNSADYIYDKTTDCPDDCKTTLKNVRPVKNVDLAAERCACLLSDTVGNVRIVDAETRDIVEDIYCNSFLDALVAFRSFVFDAANSGKKGQYPTDESFNDAVEDGFGDGGTSWTARNGQTLEIETELYREN